MFRKKDKLKWSESIRGMRFRREKEEQVSFFGYIYIYTIYSVMLFVFFIISALIEHGFKIIRTDVLLRLLELSLLFSAFMAVLVWAISYVPRTVSLTNTGYYMHAERPEITDYVDIESVTLEKSKDRDVDYSIVIFDKGEKGIDKFAIPNNEKLETLLLVLNSLTIKVIRY